MIRSVEKYPTFHTAVFTFTLTAVCACERACERACECACERACECASLPSAAVSYLNVSSLHLRVCSCLSVWSSSALIKPSFLTSRQLINTRREIHTLLLHPSLHIFLFFFLFFFSSFHFLLFRFFPVVFYSSFYFLFLPPFLRFFPSSSPSWCFSGSGGGGGLGRFGESYFRRSSFFER